MRQQNLKLKGLFDICHANGLDGRYLHELWNASHGQAVDHNANYHLKSNDWVNQFNFATQKGLDLLEKVNTFLKVKEVKTKPKIVIDIPMDKIKEFNEIWPQIKLPTKQYARCTERELLSSFTAFFKEFPTYNDWSIIMQAGTTYVSEREVEKYEFTRRSKYFVRRENKDKSVDFLLQEYYERIRDGVQEKPMENFSFEPKVY